MDIEVDLGEVKEAVVAEGAGGGSRPGGGVEGGSDVGIEGWGGGGLRGRVQHAAYDVKVERVRRYLGKFDILVRRGGFRGLRLAQRVGGDKGFRSKNV